MITNKNRDHNRGHASTPEPDREDPCQADAARNDSEQRFRVMADFAPVMIWMAGTDKRRDWFNKGWLGYTGRTLEQELGAGWGDRVHPDDLDRCLDVYTSSFDARQPFELEYRLRRHDGGYGWVLDKGVPHFAHDRSFQGYIGSCLDISERKRAEQTKSLLAAIVSSSADAMLSLTLGGTIITWNPAAERLFGYTETEAAGREAGFLAPAHLEGERRRIHDEIRGGNSITLDTLRLHKNGAVIPVSISAAPLKTAFGEIVGLTLIAHDITERKAFEARQVLLNRELSHRVKNTLAVIQSMARHTLRNSPGAEEFISAFESRLQSLATSHNILTAADWKGVDLARLVLDQVGPFLHGRQDRLALSGPRIMVHAEAATSIGLAMHELATNAAKYGALSIPAGRVDLSWARETQESGDHVRFLWRESGGPPVQPPGRKGFGSVLLAMTDKSVVIEFKPDGLCCELTLMLRPHQAKARRNATRPRRPSST